GASGLWTEIGVFYLHWFAMQRAVDSAAIAGATYLPSDTSDAVSTAKSYAQKNGLLASEVTIPALAAGATSITVNATRAVPYYFARVLGLTSGNVSVTGVAKVQPVNGAGGSHVVPIGFPCADPG